MTTRDVTIAGYVLVFASAAVLVLASWVRSDWLARFSVAVAAIGDRHRILRAGVIFAWAWLGWHFLARTG